ncbi:uncharacterized protein LOC119769581 [Culex quinquefasciatus]|uniref:uncharacterized protein LOC119769581 n=1 Tax=Culex quinquefasciatus TaxID=7176 RepID=UPI0018E2E0F2|nr:uncharacterized protein LOC119769581 [Culex quinquefasciatus]
MDQFEEDWSVEFLDSDPPPGVDSAEWSVEHLDNPQSFPAEPLEEETPDWFESFITKHELQDEDMPDANCGSLLLDRHEPLDEEMPEATSNDSGVLNIGRFLGNSNNETPSHSADFVISSVGVDGVPQLDQVNGLGNAVSTGIASPTSSTQETARILTPSWFSNPAFVNDAVSSDVSCATRPTSRTQESAKIFTPSWSSNPALVNDAVSSDGNCAARPTSSTQETVIILTPSWSSNPAVMNDAVSSDGDCAYHDFSNSRSNTQTTLKLVHVSINLCSLHECFLGKIYLVHGRNRTRTWTVCVS